jgi:lactoylglutathione lyase/glyoxylase I family protein
MGIVRGLAHVCFTVSDLERTVHFYCDQLGLAPAFPFVRDGRKVGQYIHVGGRGFIELFEGELADPADRQSYRHLCLEVEDVAAAVAALQARGVNVTEAKLGSDNSYQAWISDPDGNRIELHGYTPESKQAPYLA